MPASLPLRELGASSADAMADFVPERPLADDLMLRASTLSSSVASELTAVEEARGLSADFDPGTFARKALFNERMDSFVSALLKEG